MRRPGRRGKREPTRTERRRSHEARKTRLVLVGATVLSVIILAAWFPAGALYRQRASLASANKQIAQLHQEDVALNKERKNLSDNAEVGRIARQQYQLVSPGQQAYEILPPSGTASSNAPYASDPGSSSPVAPSAASELPPGSVTTTTLPTSDSNSASDSASDSASETTASTNSAAHSGGAPAENLFGRMERALEFWR
jgi:cell division protein FtsB